MIRLFVITCCIFVLCQSIGVAQSRDTALVFQKQTLSSEPEKPRPQLTGIVSTSLGSFSSFRADNTYGSFLQPSVGFDFLAEPGDAIHFLFGARVGFSKPITSELLLGLRQPIFTSGDHSRQIFGDFALLFFGDHSNTGAVSTGARLAIGGKFEGAVDPVIALASEFRGSRSTTVDLNRNRTLWWVGVEFGISFPIVSGYTAPTHKDSIRAAIRYIATSNELEEFDRITSNTRVDDWLYTFWKRRDVTPTTTRNEAKEEFESRVAEANLRYSSPKKLGVQSDIGRALVLYGNPDVIDHEHGTTNENISYTLWVYQRRIRSQAFAVFLFRSDGTRNMVQVFSNVPGELSGSLPYGLPATMTRWIQ